MTTLNVAIHHPGAMGISVAASALKTGHNVYWVSEGRSDQTRARAEEYRLLDAGTLDELCRVAPFKDAPETPPLDDVLAALLTSHAKEEPSDAH